MGTKRQIAGHIRREILRTNSDNQTVADLFAGIGAVSASLAGKRPIVSNDIMQFTGCFSRARFTHQPAIDKVDTLQRIAPIYHHYIEIADQNHKDLLDWESSVLGSRHWKSLQDYMAASNHVGNSLSHRQMAGRASRLEGPERYVLTQLYFAGAYYSLRQAIQIDAIRYAMSQVCDGQSDVLLSAWLAASGNAINAPGHTANYLHAHNQSSADRVRMYWRRDVWQIFQSKLLSFESCGDTAWRIRNKVTAFEAQEYFDIGPACGVAYADPPYTKDHYSRYYHVYETLYLYDYPSSTGSGRYRDSRFQSDFSVKTKVGTAFNQLAENAAQKSTSLVISYPRNGLYHSTGHSLRDLLCQYFKRVRVKQIDAQHSTMGARSGSNTKYAQEQIYVCTMPN